MFWSNKTNETDKSYTGFKCKYNECPACYKVDYYLYDAVFTKKTMFEKSEVIQYSMIECMYCGLEYCGELDEEYCSDSNFQECPMESGVIYFLKQWLLKYVKTPVFHIVIVIAVMWLAK